MRVANRALLALFGLAVASACRQTPPEQDLAPENSAAATTEIEALPPDESVATPTNDVSGGEATNSDQPANGH
jgi:hypothetical protein